MTPHVVVYTTAFCPYCAGAKELLGKKSIAFEEIKVDGDSAARVAVGERAGGQRSVPQIFVGDRHIGGCTDLYALERDDKLDELFKSD